MRRIDGNSMSDLETNDLARASGSSANQTSQPRRTRGSGGSCWPCSSLRPAAARGGGSAASGPSRSKPLTVSSRQAGTQAAVLNATGYVTARRRATVSSKITGKVIEVNIEEGMAVRQGQVLARLDDETQRASVALAEAQAEAARRNVNESEVRLNEARINLDARHQARRGGLLDGRRSRCRACRRRLARRAHPRRPRAGAGGRAPDRAGADQSRQHGHPRAVRTAS